MYESSRKRCLYVLHKLMHIAPSVPPEVEMYRMLPQVLATHNSNLEEAT